MNEPQTRNSPHVTYALALLCSVAALLPAQAMAQSCPDADPNAAAEQIVCWASLDARGDALCEQDACSARIVTLCKDAALDVPSVGHACFIAHVRQGSFAEAVALAEYLQDVPAAVQRCQVALQSVAETQIVSNPANARIEIDGVEYGPAPLTVKLKSPWWERRIVARFGTAEAASAIELSREQLAAAFDRRACAMGDVVVAGPRGSDGSATSPAQIDAPAETPLAETAPPQTPGSQASPKPSSAWIWTLSAAGVAAAGGIAFRLIGDAQYEEVEKRCAPSCSQAEIDDSGVKTSDALTVGLLATSGALIVTTGVLLLMRGRSERSQPARVSVSVAPRGLSLRGEF